MSTPRKRTSPVVLELLKAADNALAAAAVLQAQARAKRREMTTILDKIADLDWIKRYPDTVVKAAQKLQIYEAQAARWEAEAQTYESEARRFVTVAQLADRE
jgi:predicted RecB family nuclease